MVPGIQIPAKQNLTKKIFQLLVHDCHEQFMRGSGHYLSPGSGLGGCRKIFGGITSFSEEERGDQYK